MPFALQWAMGSMPEASPRVSAAKSYQHGHGIISCKLALRDHRTRQIRSMDNSSDASEQVLILELFDETTLAYLRRKHTGGRSGAKGARYEDVFAAVKLAEAARAKGVSCRHVLLQTQVPLRFVDDLLVYDELDARRSYFQLKNSPTVTWGNGVDGLSGDFVGQAILSKAESQSSFELVLVVSDSAAAQRLTTTIPDQLRDVTRVEWFPWDEPLTLLCERWESEFSALAWLSKQAEPTFHDLAEVLGILCGTWALHGSPATAHDLIDAARRLSPTLIRPLVAEEDVLRTLRDDFKATLAIIENFSYSIVKGFFAWEARHPNGTVTAGVLSHDCLSENFQAFQTRVVKLAPLTFESMEDELL